MKATNSDIYAGYGSLQKLAAYKLPAKISFQIAMLESKLKVQRVILDNLLQKMRVEYSKHDEKTDTYIMSPEDTLKFTTEWDDMMKMEVEIGGDEKIKLPLNGAVVCEKCKATSKHVLEVEPAALYGLTPFIEIAES